MKLFSSFLFLLCFEVLFAGVPGTLDTSFLSNSHPNLKDSLSGRGPDAAVSSVLVNSDGSMYVCGAFHNFNGVVTNGIVRLLPSGAVDHSFIHSSNIFGSGINQAVHYGTDKILVYGSYTSNGVYYSKIAGLTSTGSLDTQTTNSFKATDNYIHQMIIQPDSKVIILGEFTKYDGIARAKIARINTDGTLDTTFNAGTALDLLGNYVSRMYLNDDGTIFLGGHKGMIKLNADGTRDTLFKPVYSGDPPVIQCIDVQSDKKIIAGGLGFLCRFNPDGTVDNSFTCGIPQPGTSYYGLNSISLVQNGKLMVAGSYGQTDSFPLFFMRLNTDGSIDNSYSSDSYVRNLRFASGGSVEAYMTPHNDGCIIFTTCLPSTGNIIYSSIGRLGSDGSWDASFNPLPQADNLVNSIASRDNDKFIISGTFHAFNGHPYNYVARLNSTGELDSTFKNNPGLKMSINITDMTIQSDNSIILSGGIFNDGTDTSRGLLRLKSDGSIDKTFKIGPGFGISSPRGTPSAGTVNSVAILSNGNIIFGGDFNLYNNFARNIVACIQPDGTLVTEFDPGKNMDGTIKKIVLQPDHKILLIGSFTKYGTTTLHGIVRLNDDGTLDSTFKIVNVQNNTFNTIALQQDNKILVGGNFLTIGGLALKGIARLNADGSIDSSFDKGGSGFGSTTYNGGIVNTISVQNNGKIIVGGIFTSYSNTNYKGGIACLNEDGSLDTTFKADGAISGGSIRSIMCTNDGLIVGGSFILYDGIVRNNLARIFNASGSSNVYRNNCADGIKSNRITTMYNGRVVNIMYRPSKSTDLTISVSNCKGQIVKNIRFRAEVIGTSKIPISFERESSGMYIISVKDGNRRIANMKYINN